MFRYNQWAVDEIIQMLMCYAVTSMQCMSALVFALGETASEFDRASGSSLAHLSAKKWLYHTPLAGRPWATWSKPKDLRRCQPYSNWSQHYVQYHNPWWLPIVINHKVYTAVPPCDAEWNAAWPCNSHVIYCNIMRVAAKRNNYCNAVLVLNKRTSTALMVECCRVLARKNIKDHDTKIYTEPMSSAQLSLVQKAFNNLI